MNNKSLKKVLLVDDSPEFIDVTKDLLESFNLSVITATSAIEARIAASHTAIDVFIIDHRLGECDGIHLAHELIDKSSRKISVAILSGIDFGESTKSHLTQAGIHFFVKGRRLEQFIEFCQSSLSYYRH